MWLALTHGLESFVSVCFLTVTQRDLTLYSPCATLFPPGWPSNGSQFFCHEVCSCYLVLLCHSSEKPLIRGGRASARISEGTIQLLVGVWKVVENVEGGEGGR